MQHDFEIEELSAGSGILVVTPEKLVYVLRQVPELASKIGLLIYDEGHQFDTGTRGVTYELLITSLNSMVSADTQKVLISAVISNAEQINLWLNPGDSKVVSGINLGPTLRTIGFASWKDPLGRLEFVPQDELDRSDFFVPRVIETIELQRQGTERKTRLFPEKGNGTTIALYLGLKLVANGAVAIFCGTKASVSKLCETALDAFARGLPLARPIVSSNEDEVKRLWHLHRCNLGDDSSATMASALGIFSHHGNTPHGIRLAIEHAMKEKLINFVICTSTLGQGVNLPIRYLIVTSLYQGGSRIKIRDFHNLIGRAGRSGMHTEGSILFADSEIFDQRRNRDENWRWAKMKELLDPRNSEPCVSALLSLFDPLRSDDGKSWFIMEPLDFVKAYVEDPDSIDELPKDLLKEERQNRTFTESGLARQISSKMEIISAIESYLMAHWEVTEGLNLEENAKKLAVATLAYHLADEAKREQIVGLFQLLAGHVVKNVPETTKRTSFGKTLFGVKDLRAIEIWVSGNYTLIADAKSIPDLLGALWPLFTKYVNNATFQRCSSLDAVLDLAKGWIEGRPFHELLAIFLEAQIQIQLGKSDLAPSSRAIYRDSICPENGPNGGKSCPERTLDPNRSSRC